MYNLVYQNSVDGAAWIVVEEKKKKKKVPLPGFEPRLKLTTFMYMYMEGVNWCELHYSGFPIVMYGRTKSCKKHHLYSCSF